MPRKPKDIEKVLKGKCGFAVAKNRSTDHRYYTLQLDGLPALFTKFSLCKDDIGSGLESKIAKQIRVRKAFFDLLMACKKTTEEYHHEVRTNAFPPFEDRL